MEAAAFALPIASVGVVALVLRRNFLSASAPSLFVLMCAGIGLSYVSAVRGESAPLLSATLGAVLAGVGLVLVILESDAREAADEHGEPPSPTRLWLWSERARRWNEFEGGFRAHVAFLGWTKANRPLAPRVTTPPEKSDIEPSNEERWRPSVSEALFSFERKGRSALLVFVRRDHMGHVLDATAHDPEDYL